MSLDYTLIHSALELFPFSHEIQKRQIVTMMDDMTIVNPEASVASWCVGYIKSAVRCNWNSDESKCRQQGLNANKLQLGVNANRPLNRKYHKYLTDNGVLNNLGSSRDSL